MTPFVSSIIWITTIVVASCVDLFLAKDRVAGNTLSELIRNWSENTIMIPWVVGVLCGHWFHWFQEGNAFEAHKMLILIMLTLPVLLGGIFIHNLINPFPNWLLMLVLQAGLAAGAFLWRV